MAYSAEPPKTELIYLIVLLNRDKSIFIRSQQNPNSAGDSVVNDGILIKKKLSAKEELSLKKSVTVLHHTIIVNW